VLIFYFFANLIILLLKNTFTKNPSLAETGHSNVKMQGFVK